MRPGPGPGPTPHEVEKTRNETPIQPRNTNRQAQTANPGHDYPTPNSEPQTPMLPQWDQTERPTPTPPEAEKVQNETPLQFTTL